MFPGYMIQSFATLLMTYALHSAILLGCALLVAHFFAKNRPAFAENLLRLALLGGLVTAGLQTGLNLKPWTYSTTIFHQQDISPVVVQAVSPGVVFEGDGLDPTPKPSARAAISTNTPAVSEVSNAPPAPEKHRISIFPEIPLENALLAIWALVAFVLCLRLTISWCLFFGRIKDREEVTDNGLLMALGATLAGQRPMHSVRLTVSPYLQSPVAFGFFRPEISIPQRVLDADPVHRESLLAHETAHLLARDPAWLLTYRVLECVFFFQPLNRIARKRLQEIAEFRCDHYAAVHTGKPLDLARCLTEVASWQISDSNTLPVPGMTGSELGRRVHRLLDFSDQSKYKLSKGFWPVAILVLIGLATTMPGFSVAGVTVPKMDPPAVSPAAIAPPEIATAPESSPTPEAAPPVKPALAERPLPTHSVFPPTPENAKPMMAALAWPDNLPSVQPSAQQPDERMLEEQIDQLVETFEDMMEDEFDALADRLDDLADIVEDRYEEKVLLAWRAGAVEKKFEELEDQIDAFNDFFDDQITDFEIEWESLANSEENFKRIQEGLGQWRESYRKQLLKLTAEVDRLEKKYAR